MSWIIATPLRVKMPMSPLRRLNSDWSMLSLNSHEVLSEFTS